MCAWSAFKRVRNDVIMYAQIFVRARVNVCMHKVYASVYAIM